MQLAEQLAELVDLAARLKAEGKDLSEANTKVSFIQPLLEALGWKVADPGEVVLEYPVFGGTRLDYALLVDARPALYLEAKALRRSIDEASFIAQTVSYANNDGIRWCVLTNGLIWRIYKSDELAPADKKLLAEADIREATDAFGAARVASTLAYLSKESLAEGRLDAWGERVFLDTAVHRSLELLFAEAPGTLVNLVRKNLEEDLSPKKIREALQRIGANQPGENVGEPPEQKDGGPDKAHDLHHHLQNKPQAIIDLFYKLDQTLLALGPGISRVPKKASINYELDRCFVSVSLTKSRLLMNASIAYADAPKPEGISIRDVSNVGHYGPGDTQVSISLPQDIAGAEMVAKASLAIASSP